MKNLSCFLTTLLFCSNTFSFPADSLKIAKIYHVNRPVMGLILTGGLISNYFAISRIKNKKQITENELEGLNPGLLNTIDAWALHQDPGKRIKYKQISDMIQIPLFIIPGLLAFNTNIRNDWFNILLMYAEGHTLTFSSYNYSFLGPTFQNRFRPMTYYAEFPDAERRKGNNRNSFYSGHVASCAYSTFFMAKVYCDYHPRLGAKKCLIYTFAAIPPLLMGYFRVKALDHFPSDNAVGLALGLVMGIIIPELHKKPCSKYPALGMFNSSYGSGLSLSWTL